MKYLDENEYLAESFDEPINAVEFIETVYYIVAGNKKYLVTKERFLEASCHFRKIVAGRNLRPMSVDGYVY